MNSSRIPPLLQPYVKLPREDSLLLVTSTLGASANWLLIRFLCDALNTQDGGAGEGHNVVLVSWMRDYEFWKQEARKGGGLDLERLKREKRFAFVDGLSGLVMGQPSTVQSASSPPQPVQSPRPATATVPQRASPLPARGPPARGLPAAGPPARTLPTRGIVEAPPSPTQDQKQGQGHYTLLSPSLQHLHTTLLTALSNLPAHRTLLVLDAPDLPLALCPPTTTTTTTTTPTLTLPSLIQTLHSTSPISHILTHMHADTPLLTPSTPPQPLETASFNLLTKLAGQARRVLGTRVLDTGVARDVGGVVRITENGGGWMDLSLGLENVGGESEGIGEGGREFLYRVRGDGGVKVFERGAGET